jgi:hypothetical protein
VNPVALVEAPKTAVIGTLCYGLPDSPGHLLWLAVYNKSSLTLEKCKVLKGRKVVLFPDLNAFNEWNEKTKSIKASLPGTQFVVSDLLERNASEADIKNGLDLADYLNGLDYRQLRKGQTPVETIAQPLAETPPQDTQTSPEPIILPPAEPLPKAPNEAELGQLIKEGQDKGEIATQSTGNVGTLKQFSECATLEHTVKTLSDIGISRKESSRFKQIASNWDQVIAELEIYFASIVLPTEPIKLNQCSIIFDCSKFIDSHLNTVKFNNGKPTFEPFLNRLEELQQWIVINLN